LRRYILIFALAATAIEYPRPHPIAQAVIPVTCGIFVALLGLEGLSSRSVMISKGKRPSRIAQNLALFSAVMMLALIVIQLAPLPEGLLGFASKSSESFRKNSGEFGDGFWATVSMCGYQTKLTLLKWLSAFIGFLGLAFIIGRGDRIRLSRVLSWMPVPFFVIAISLRLIVKQELVELGTDSRWYKPFGPWPDVNHFAICMAMMLPLTFCRFMYRMDSIATSTNRRASRYVKAGLIGAIPLILVLYMAAFAPRQALLACGVGLFIMTLAAWRFTRGTISRMAICLVIGPACLICLLASRNAPYSTAITGGVPVTSSAQWSYFRSFKLIGSGAGTFPTVYQAYRDGPASEGLEGPRPTHDIAALACETGVIGVALAVILSALVIISGLKATLRAQSANLRWLLLGAGTGFIVFLIHSLSSYNMSVTSSLFLAAVAAGYSISGRKRDDFRWSRVPLGIRAPLAGVMILIGIGISWAAVNVCRGQLQLMQGRLLTGQGAAMRLSENHLMKAASISPDSPTIMLELGKHFYGMSKDPDSGPKEANEAAEKSRWALRTAIRNAPAHPDAYYWLGRLESTQSTDPSKAKAFLSHAVELSPHASNYLLELGDFHEKYGEKDEAIKCFRKGLVSAPRLLPDILKRGLALCTGIEDWHQLIPHEFRSDGQLARFLMEEEKSQLAGEEIFLLCKEMETAQTLPSTRLMEVIEKVLEPEKAITWFAKWHERFPTNLMLAQSYCRALTQLKRFRSAENILQELRKHVPAERAGEVNVMLAGVQEAEGRIEDAESTLISAVQSSTKNPVCPLALGEFYIRHEKPDQAVKVLYKARRDWLDDVRLLKSLAKAYEAQGEFNQALSCLESAGAASRSDPEIADSISRIRTRLTVEGETRRQQLKDAQKKEEDSK